MQLLHQGQLSPADIANLPTTAEKAALDAGTGANGTNPYMTRGPAGDLPQAVVDALAATAIGSGETFATVAATGATLTPDQVAAITGATSPNASNLFVTRGDAGNLTNTQLGALAANTDLGGGNLVAGQRQLLKMAYKVPSGAGTQVTWNTGLTGITGYSALLVIYPNAGGAPSVISAASISGAGLVTWNPANTDVNDTIIAYLFDGIASSTGLVVA